MTNAPKPEWLKIAADMIDAKSAKMDKDSSPEHVQAMHFLFEQGVFHLGAEGMQTIKGLLLDRYAKETANG
jgi:hypothetical protein